MPKKKSLGMLLESDGLSGEEFAIMKKASVAPEKRTNSFHVVPSEIQSEQQDETFDAFTEENAQKEKPKTKPKRNAKLEVETDSMEKKKEQPKIRVQRTFRIYPEILEALSDAAVERKKQGFELWSQDAIVNDALSKWLFAAKN